MTVDHETIEALRDDPELLALADALQSAGDRIEAPAARRPRRVSIRVAAVGLAAVAALVLLLVSPWDTGSGPSFVDKALAAVGDQPVLHVVVRYDIGQRVDLRTGRTTTPSRDLDLWYDQSRHVYRYETRIDGRVINRASGTGDLGLEPFLLTDLYRKALRSGKVKVAGEATIRGRRALIAEAHQPQGGIVRAYIDAEDYHLLRMQYLTGGAILSQVDVLRYETVSRAEARLPKPKPGPIHSAGTSSLSGGGSGSEISLTDARKSFATPPLWPGRRVGADHELQSVQLEKVTDESATRKATGRKLELQYGPTSPPVTGEPYLLLDETPVDSPLWQVESVYPPPAGYVDVMSGETSDGKNTRTQWTAVMQQDGFVVQLTSWSRDTLLAAARALRALP